LRIGIDLLEVTSIQAISFLCIVFEIWKVDSLSALQGAMIHSLIEAGLVFVSKENLEEENRSGSRIAALYSTLVQEANRIVDSQLENLYGLSEDDQDLRALLQAFVPQIVKWLEYNIMRPDSRLATYTISCCNIVLEKY